MEESFREEKITRKKKEVKHKPDVILMLAIIFLVAFGVLMVYSASYYNAMTTTGNPFFFVKKQGILGVLGIIGMVFVAYKLDYRIFANEILCVILYIVSLAAVVALFFIGAQKNGATRWLDIGGISFQPSELVKIAVILALSGYLKNHRKDLHKAKYVLTAWVLFLVPTAIIATENLSSAIVVGVIGATIIFVGTPKVWYYPVCIILIGIMGFYVYYLAMSTPSGSDELPGIQGKILKQYRLDRLRVWKDPFIDPQGGGYQPIQSLYAIGSGGIFGLGLSKGVQKLGFLPEPHNDIIFSVICEELGLVGAILVLLVYTIVVVRGLSISTKAPDYFGTLVATGISVMVGIQVLINVAVNTNTIPNTGMQLPLISYGGTALVILLGALGILLNISRSSRISKIDN